MTKGFKKRDDVVNVKECVDGLMTVRLGKFELNFRLKTLMNLWITLAA